MKASLAAFHASLASVYKLGEEIDELSGNLTSSDDPTQNDANRRQRFLVD